MPLSVSSGGAHRIRLVCSLLSAGVLAFSWAFHARAGVVVSDTNYTPEPVQKPVKCKKLLLRVSDNGTVLSLHGTHPH